MKDMFYERHTLRHRMSRKLLSYKAFRHATELAAGVHAANGLTHAVSPSDTSIARKSARQP